MSESDDEKALEELENSLDAQALLEQYQALSEKLHVFQTDRLDALKRLEEIEAHQKLDARQHFFDHHVAALEATAEHGRSHQEIDAAIEEDLHLLAGKRKILEEILASQTEEAQEENRHKNNHEQQALLELLEFLKEKKAHYEHLLANGGTHIGFNHRLRLTPGAGHGHAEEKD